MTRRGRGEGVPVGASGEVRTRDCHAGLRCPEIPASPPPSASTAAIEPSTAVSSLCPHPVKPNLPTNRPTNRLPLCAAWNCPPLLALTDSCPRLVACFVGEASTRMESVALKYLQGTVGQPPTAVVEQLA